MKPLVGILMGSASDLPLMTEAAKVLESFEIPFEINVLSAHRTPDKALEYARAGRERGLKVFIAGAGGAAHLPGVVAAMTPLPVIGVPVNSSNSIEGLDSLLSIVQMPGGVPVACVAVDGAHNAGILAVQIIATGDPELQKKVIAFKENLKEKIYKSAAEINKLDFKFMVK
ncbi:MAG TPA: 5-(carboxyamino)imidazole ribonucleotide mutase [Bacteroidia bacterium]|jgi:5-(carboxyamino)imidazole ribonucleotide mutase|nr:5-(carboxyamino)imidazole ribonucleotide mutase [Bacteroidia bacterium]